MVYHLWNSFSPKKISVDINPTFKDNLKNYLKDDVYTVAKKLSVNPSRLYEYFIYQTAPIPLNILINLCNKYEIQLKDLEKEIIYYKQMFVPIKNSVKNPVLPLNVNPYFTSIIAHLFFDGSMPKDGKGTYYNQKNEEIMQDFVEKIRLVFGDVNYSIKQDHRGVLKCRLPRIIGEISKQIYGVNSFGTFNSRIPKKILDLNMTNKKAFIFSAITDEGSITYDGTIMFGINNRLMCEDVRKLCLEINLKTSKLKNKKGSNFYYFHIKSLDKFKKIYERLIKNYPSISLRYKEDRLNKSLRIKEQNFLYTKNFADKRKSLILNELKSKKYSINQLASKYLIPPRTIRRYMYKLIKEGSVKRQKISNEYFYYLV